MVYESKNRKKVCRSRKDKVFAGVCGGLAEHFGVSATWLRIGFIVGSFLTSFSLVPILYLVCLIVMPIEPTGYARQAASNQGSERHRRHHGTGSGNAATSRFQNREEAFAFLHQQFDRIEQKVRRMEDHVTSKEYVLRRKFEEL